MQPTFKPLYVIQCLPGSLGQEVTPDRAKELLQNSLVAQKLLQPSDVLGKFTNSIYRLVVAPYPLSMSIAKAFLPNATEVIFDRSVIDPTDNKTAVLNEEEILQQLGLGAKLRPCYFHDTLEFCFNMPPGKVTVAVVTTLFYQRTISNSSPEHYVIKWPPELRKNDVREESKLGSRKKITVPIPTHQPSPLVKEPLFSQPQTIPLNRIQPSFPTPAQVLTKIKTVPVDLVQAEQERKPLEISPELVQVAPPRQEQATPTIILTYLDDEAAARLRVKVMKSVKPLILQKKGELEQLTKAQTVLSSVSDSVLQGVQEITSQLQMKDLPPLQLPQLKLEEDDSLTQQMRLFGENSRHILASLTDLKSALQSWQSG